MATLFVFRRLYSGLTQPRSPNQSFAESYVRSRDVFLKASLE
jgi:hypothetical protein